MRKLLLVQETLNEKQIFIFYIAGIESYRQWEVLSGTSSLALFLPGPVEFSDAPGRDLLCRDVLRLSAGRFSLFPWVLPAVYRCLFYKLGGISDMVEPCREYQNVFQ